MSPTLRKLTTKAAAVATVAMTWSIGLAARAQDLSKESGLDFTAEAAGIPKKTGLSTMIGRAIEGMIAMMGALFLVLTVYAGFLYMTAQGNEEKVKRAKSILTGSIIGLVIVVGAYTLVGYVISNVVTPIVSDAPATPQGP
jgi:hypothetical protein